MSLKAKEYSGCWWFASNPGQEVTGSLSISESEGIELKTIGSLLPQHSLFDNRTDGPSQEILLGKAVDGSCITLVRTIYTSFSGEISSDLSKCTHVANLAIVGKRHFLSKDELLFSSAEAGFSLLDKWLCKTGFTAHKESYKQGHWVKFSLEYEYPEVLEFFLESINATLKTNYVFNRKKQDLDWQLSHKSLFRLTPAEPQTFDWYSRNFERLRKFLIVMTGFPVSTGEVFGYGNELHTHGHSDVKNREKFQVHQKIPSGLLGTSNKQIDNLLIDLPSLGIEVEVVLNNWFKKSELLSPAIILYTATLSVDLVYAEFRLLNYAQALEALHRRVFGGQYMADDTYEAIASTLVENIPKEVDIDHRRSLEGRLKYGNEYSQRKRISRLLNDVWTGCLDSFIEDKNDFISKVISTRNYLIHFDSSSESKAVFGIDIFYMSERLKILLVTHILIQLHIPRESVYRAVKQFRPFASLKCQKF
jgi:hypothetical protein